MKRLASRAADAATFALLNLINLREGPHTTTPADIEGYLAVHGSMTLEEFYAAPAPKTAAPEFPAADAPPLANAQGLPLPYVIRWPSPWPSGNQANDNARMNFFPARVGWPDRPTVFLLHALMSASDLGYRMWARDFHARGWNVCFMHLPYHYSRRPPGMFNGELAVSSNLLRTGEGLRQAVKELRALRATMERVGAREFAVWGTSYGGWTAALWSMVEADFRFVALVQPIVDVYDVIWRSPAGRTLRRQLRQRGVTRELKTLEGLFRLGMPAMHQPPGDLSHLWLAAGDLDVIVRATDLRALHARWAGSKFFTGPQAHYGYYLMREMFRRLEAAGCLTDAPVVPKQGQA